MKRRATDTVVDRNKTVRNKTANVMFSSIQYDTVNMVTHLFRCLQTIPSLYATLCFLVIFNVSGDMFSKPIVFCGESSIDLAPAFELDWLLLSNWIRWMNHHTERFWLSFNDIIMTPVSRRSSSVSNKSSSSSSFFAIAADSSSESFLMLGASYTSSETGGAWLSSASDVEDIENIFCLNFDHIMFNLACIQSLHRRKKTTTRSKWQIFVIMLLNLMVLTTYRSNPLHFLRSYTLSSSFCHSICW